MILSPKKNWRKKTNRIEPSGNGLTWRPMPSSSNPIAHWQCVWENTPLQQPRVAQWFVCHLSKALGFSWVCFPIWVPIVATSGGQWQTQFHDRGLVEMHTSWPGHLMIFIHKIYIYIPPLILPVCIEKKYIHLIGWYLLHLFMI